MASAPGKACMLAWMRRDVRRGRGAFLAAKKAAQSQLSKEEMAAAQRKSAAARGESIHKASKKLIFPYENIFFSSSIPLAIGE